MAPLVAPLRFAYTRSSVQVNSTLQTAQSFVPRLPHRFRDAPPVAPLITRAMSPWGEGRPLSPVASPPIYFKGSPHYDMAICRSPIGYVRPTVFSQCGRSGVVVQRANRALHSPTLRFGLSFASLLPARPALPHYGMTGRANPCACDGIKALRYFRSCQMNAPKPFSAPIVSMSQGLRN